MGAIPDSWWCSFHFSIQRIPTQEAQYSSEVKGTRNWKAGDDRERPLTIWLQASAIIPSIVQFSHPLPLSKRQSEQRRTIAIHLHLFFLPPWEALLGSCHGDNGAMSNTGHCTEAPENQCWPCWKCFRDWFIVLKEKMGIWPEWGKHCKTLCLQRVIRLVTERFGKENTHSAQTYKRLKERMKTLSLTSLFWARNTYGGSRAPSSSLAFPARLKNDIK